MVGHEAFWSTIAQLVAIGGGAVLIGVGQARKRVGDGFVDRAWMSLVGVVYGGLYLALETVALLVLAGAIPDQPSLRGGVTVWTIGILTIGAVGWRYFVLLARVSDRGTEVIDAGGRLARTSARRTARRLRLMTRLRARRRQRRLLTEQRGR